MTKTTSFMTIYDSFLARITDDMYLEMTEWETFQCLQDLLINAIPRFEFPRFNIFDYELGYLDEGQTYQGVLSDNKKVPAAVWVGGFFNAELTEEEVNIMSLNMVIEWLGQQLETTELSKMKFPGSDFKMSSQANHMAKLKILLDGRKTDGRHMQRLYKRRIAKNGKIISTMGDIVSEPSYGVKGNYNGVTSFWTKGRI